MTAHTLSLANQNPLFGKVEVLNLRTSHLTSSGTCVDGKDEHWIQKRVRRSLLHETENLKNLRQHQEGGIPRFDSFLSGPPQGDFSLNLGNRLKWRFLGRLGVAEPLFGKRPVNVFVVLSPAPDHVQCGDLFFDCRRTELPAV